MAVRLAAVEYGAGPPLAILHGLFGSGRNWAGIAQHLAANHRVIALDLRNHGASAWADAMDYPAMAQDVHETLVALGYPRFALLGHSMGGKAAMILALAHSEAVERLVVVDIAPVAYPPRHLPYVKAMRAMDLTGVKRRAELDAPLAAVVADPAERAFLLQNIVFEDGKARWRVNLEAIENAMPDLVGFPMPPADGAYQKPALFIAGGRSDFVQPAYEPAIRRLFPAARILRIETASHWVHAEQPQAFLAAVEPFLAHSAP
jgi:pimeloyl-ACP methyl ester carboxylesterase